MPNWLSGTTLDELRADIRQLLEDGAFHESGLTQKLGPDSPSTENDRRERLVCEMRPDLGGNLAAREAIDARLEKLRCDLEASTGRKLSLEEQYYSFSPAGAALARHMDERHEETKGEDAWSAESRRSISWLLYLSDDGWVEAEPRIESSSEGASGGCGGQLRAYCRSDAVAPVGAHEGNLQVGWLRCCTGALGASDVECYATDGLAGPLVSRAVFHDAWCRPTGLDPLDPLDPIDAWCRPTGGGQGHDLTAEECAPEAVLYCVCGTDGNERRHVLTGPIVPGDGAFAAESDGGGGGDGGGGMEWRAFGEALRSYLPPLLQDRFSSVVSVDAHSGDTSAEERRAHGTAMVDVNPSGGTLVLFDSVAVPHEVLPVVRGERLALAGWFHEVQQEWPSWL